MADQPRVRRKLSRPRSLLVIAVTVAAVFGTVAAVVVVRQRHSPHSPGAAPGPPAAAVLVLPLGKLDHPSGVAVDDPGNLYVTDSGGQRVLTLPAGGSVAREIPFTGLHFPEGIAVDHTGNIYVTDVPDRVLKFDVGTGAQTVLPSTGWRPSAVAVDQKGNLYVANTDSRLVKVDNETGAQVDFAFAGLHGGPVGVAVDAAGNLYVTGYIEHKALMIAAGTTTPAELPFPALEHPGGITVDAAGGVYLTDAFLKQVYKLARGARSSVPLPLTGLDYPEGVAVDHVGNVYVADTFHDRVLKLVAPA